MIYPARAQIHVINYGLPRTRLNDSRIFCLWRIKFHEQVQNTKKVWVSLPGKCTSADYFKLLYTGCSDGTYSEINYPGSPFDNNLSLYRIYSSLRSLRQHVDCCTKSVTVQKTQIGCQNVWLFCWLGKELMVGASVSVTVWHETSLAGTNFCDYERLLFLVCCQLKKL